MSLQKTLLYGATTLGVTTILAASSFAMLGGEGRPKIDFENAPAQIQAILTQAKEEGKDSITDEQREVLKAYHEEQREARLAELPDDIRTLLEKAHEEGRDSLTDDEQATLKAYMEENRPEGFEGRGGHGSKGPKGPRIDFENAPAQIQAILTQAKEEGKDSITDEQREVLKAYHEEQREARLAELPDDIRTLLEKAHEEGRDSLTDDEQATLKAYMEENRPEGFEGRGGRPGSTSES